MLECTDILLDGPVDCTDAVGSRGHREHIIQECHQSLRRMETSVDGLQCAVLSQAVEHGHQWVALLTTLALEDRVRNSCIVLPQVL